MSDEAGRASKRTEEILRILRAGPICADCLGRAYGKAGRGLSNEERGRAVLAVSSLLGGKARESGCWVCGELFSRAGEWAERAAERARGYRFSTYLFGVRLSPRLEEAEALFAERFPTGAIEPMKHAFNRAVGLCFNALHPETTVAFDDPEISFVIDIEGDELAMNVGSIYLFGRYRKLVRGIPQTRWPCRRCRGRGCASCGGTGKQYPESVEEWIAAPFVEASAAAGQRFHGAGREDIDARMLGDGRPFVLELVAPRVRELDLAGLREEANRRAAGRVETSELRIVRRAAVEFVKERKAAKRYRARVEFAGDVSPGDLRSALEGLTGEVAQRTPRRVAHRRADKVRRRRLMGASVGNSISPRAAEIEFATEGGLYVKELVSGDDGRTEPSLAARLGLGARVTELDVLEIAWPRDREGRLDIPFALP